MLFASRLWPGLADGTITVAFRRWRRPTVKAADTLVTPAGVLAIDEVTVIKPAAITEDDARAAGFASRQEASADLRPEGTLYLIRFHRLGDDPRIALRRLDALDERELSDLRQRLDRLDWAVPSAPTPQP